MPYYRCLRCGHRLYVSEDTSRGLIRCSNYQCRSYWMMPEETYENIVENLANIVNDNTPILDLFSGIIEILRTNGISGQPIKTLQMAYHLVQEAERRKRKRSDLSVVEP